MKTLFILIVGLLGGAAAVFVWNTHIHGNSGVEALATNGDNKSNNKNGYKQNYLSNFLER